MKARVVYMIARCRFLDGVGEVLQLEVMFREWHWDRCLGLLGDVVREC